MRLQEEADAKTRIHAQADKGREIRRRFQIACATAHGIGGGMSANELMAYVEEHGLPSRAERERIANERMAAEGGDNTSS